MSQLVFKKQADLIASLTDLKNVLVLFSGGVDSSFILYSAIQALGYDNVLAIIGVSPSLSQMELVNAKNFAAMIKAKLIEVHSNELDNNAYLANTGNRCYFCKIELNLAVKKFLTENIRYQDWTIIDGLQASDNVDDRPGYKANQEYSIRHPLYELGFEKEEIRSLCLSYNLSIYDKPQSACLASRIMPGTRVSKDLLNKVEAAEEILINSGFLDFRVRVHSLSSINSKYDEDQQLLARIELSNNENVKLLFNPGLTQNIKKLGFDYVTIDLEGYRQGGFVKSNKLQII